MVQQACALAQLTPWMLERQLLLDRLLQSHHHSLPHLMSSSRGGAGRRGARPLHSSMLNTHACLAQACRSSGCAGCAGGGVRGGSDRPLAYSAFGAGCAEVEIDVLTGQRIIHRCDILFDCGHSFNPAVDIGQVLLARALQGQALGWCCLHAADAGSPAP